MTNEDYKLGDCFKYEQNNDEVKVICKDGTFLIGQIITLDEEDESGIGEDGICLATRDGNYIEIGQSEIEDIKLASQMEIEYDKYRLRNDLVIESDSLTFYRIFNKEYFHDLKSNISLIALPKYMFNGCKEKASHTVIDEDGKSFTLDNPCMIHELTSSDYWYTNTYTFVLKNIDCKTEMGDYLAIVK